MGPRTTVYGSSVGPKSYESRVWSFPSSTFSYVLYGERKRKEPPHDKTNKMACAPSEDSDQPGHPPSLIRVFAVRMKIAWVLSYPLSAQRRLWSVWANVQADLSLCWAHMSFCWFCHEAAHRSSINEPEHEKKKKKMAMSAQWKQLIEKSRECHNHKPQPTTDTKRKSKMTKTNTYKNKQTNAR